MGFWYYGGLMICSSLVYILEGIRLIEPHMFYGLSVYVFLCVLIFPISFIFLRKNYRSMNWGKMLMLLLIFVLFLIFYITTVLFGFDESVSDGMFLIFGSITFILCTILGRINEEIIEMPKPNDISNMVG